MALFAAAKAPASPRVAAVCRSLPKRLPVRLDKKTPSAIRSACGAALRRVDPGIALSLLATVVAFIGVVLVIRLPSPKYEAPPRSFVTLIMRS